MEMFTLNAEEAVGKDGKTVPAKKGPEIEISADKLPEIADYTVGDTVELHVICKVRAAAAPLEAPVPGAPAEGAEKLPDAPVIVKLEITDAGIMETSKKPERKNAERMGLDKERYQKVQGRRSSMSAMPE